MADPADARNAVDAELAGEGLHLAGLALDRDKVREGPDIGLDVDMAQTEAAGRHRCRAECLLAAALAHELGRDVVLQDVDALSADAGGDRRAGSAVVGGAGRA